MNFFGTEFALRDRVSTAVNQGGLPILREIEEDIGPESVEPIYLSLIMNHGLDRKIGHAGALHSINAVSRPFIWQLGYLISPGGQVRISYHDSGEDYGGGTFPGTLAINHWIGNVFGNEHENAANVLTNFYSMIVKYVRANGPITRRKQPSDITPEDVRSDLGSLEERIIVHARQDSVYNRQKAAIRVLSKRLDSFESSLGNSNIPESDKAYVRDLIGKYRVALHQSSSEPLSEEQIRQFAEPYFTAIRSLLSGEFEPEDTALFDRGRSPVFHVVRKGAYGLYLDDVTGLSSDMAGKPFYVDLNNVEAKLAERADNTRKSPYRDMVSNASDYAKTEMLSAKVDKAQPRYNQMDPHTAENIQGGNEFLKSQLMLRIIIDYSQVSREVDTDFGPHKGWLVQHFAYVSDTFGQPFQEKFDRYLRKQPWRVAAQRSEAEKLIPDYDSLLAETGRQYRGMFGFNFRFAGRTFIV